MTRAGKEFRHYKLEKEIGEGRFGAVSQAIDQRCAQAVAVKLLKQEITEDTAVQRRLMPVLGPAIYFNHPGVMRVFNADVVEGETLVVTELFSGPSLEKLLEAMRARQRWIPMAEALSLVDRLGDALDYVQQHGAMRRRLLPTKIRFRIEESSANGGEHGSQTRQLCPVIADLGIDMDSEIRESLKNERIITQPMLNYLAPEELQGKATDGRADVFALGMLTLELVCGQQVVKADRVADALDIHINHQVRVRQILRGGQPEALLSLLERALSSKPPERPATVRDFMREVAVIAAGDLPATLPREATAGGTTLLEEFQHYREVPKPAAGKAPAPRKNQAPKEKQQSADPSITQRRRVGVEITSPTGEVRVITVAKDEATIGRSPANVIVLEDESKRISREHARMRFLDGNWHVEDHHSGNGTQLDGQRLPPDVAKRWDAGALVQIEGYKLRLVEAQTKADLVDVQGAAATADASIYVQSLGIEVPRARFTFSPGEGRIGVFLETPLVGVEPGKLAQCPVVVLNQSPGPIQIHAKLIHTLAGDAVLEPGSVQLQPGDQRLLVLAINLPRSRQSRAGLYPLQMVIADRDAPSHTATVDLRVQVGAYSAYQVRIDPEQPQVGQPFEVEIDNEGNTSQEFVVMIWDEAQAVKFEPSRAELRIEAGETEVVSFTPSLIRSHWFGTRQHKARLQISAAGGETQTRSIEIASRGAIG